MDWCAKRRVVAMTTGFSCVCWLDIDSSIEFCQHTSFRVVICCYYYSVRSRILNCLRQYLFIVMNECFGGVDNVHMNISMDKEHYKHFVMDNGQTSSMNLVLDGFMTVSLVSLGHSEPSTSTSIYSYLSAMVDDNRQTR